MFTFLKLLPLKDYVYLGALLVLVTGFTSWSVHERHAQAAKDAAVTAKLATAQRERNTAVLALATTRIKSIGETYDATLNAPIADSPHVFVCKRPAPGGAVPEAAGHPGVAPAASDSAETAPRDIGPPIDTIGRNADALITALQNTVKILLDAMNGKTAP